MRNLFALVFVLTSFVVSGCFSSHGSPDLVGSAVDNSDPFVGGDAGPTEPDLGPTEVDAGSDAFVPMEDAGSDAGSIPTGECAVGETRHCYSGLPRETDGVGQCHGSEQRCIANPDGSGRWEHALIDCVGEVTPYPLGEIPDDDIDNDCNGETDVDAGSVICDAVDVPADGSGHVNVRVEGGGDMTVAPDTDFVAFSVVIENHMPTSVSADTHTHGWTLSADCSVAGVSAALINECDAMNRFHPSAGSCGGGTCGYSCAETGPVFASGTSTRFTAYAHTRASGTFGLELGFGTRPTWITFRNTLGSILATEVVDGDESSARPIATITAP